MAKYRKVSTVIQNDEKFRKLTDDAKLIFYTVLTHQHMTSVGAMRMTIAGLADELGWKHERVWVTVAERFPNGMLRYDKKSSTILLPNFMKHNAPDNQNAVKAWVHAIEMIPEGKLKLWLMERLGQEFRKHDEKWREAFETVALTLSERYREPFRNGMANQEQEQEKELRGEDLPASSRSSPINGDRTSLSDEGDDSTPTRSGGGGHRSASSKAKPEKKPKKSSRKRPRRLDK